MTADTKTCPACGAAADGNFCATCGTALGRRTCPQCQATLSPEARFCHRCGTGVPGAAAAPAAAGAPSAHAAAPGPVTGRAPWFVAGAIVALLLGAIGYRVWSGARPAGSPAMANPGNGGALPAGAEAPFAGGAGGGLATGPAPDISKLTPRERFDRLFNRIMTAAERGDTTTVVTFTPMALGAYSQLDSVDADARYHAAVLDMQVGDFPAALALADTILAKQPGHLFGYVIRGTVAQFRNDPVALRLARQDFQQHYAREMAAKRVEYLEHKPILDEFQQQAEGRDGGTAGAPAR
ncbi:MAG TPA: zinc ribbon domain-containing protein [Gemmatimonadales bacterium]|nr:zinc ribbon domain-containing protein [Gemmatimonadales bacterium]